MYYICLVEKTPNIISRSFAGEKTPAKASFLQILKSKLGTPTRAERVSFFKFYQMKKVIFHLFFFFSFLSSINSQNLVPNPSFENIVSCPIATTQICLAPPWFQPNFFNGINTSTSDLFNACCTISSQVGVPINIVGYQNARTGIGYAGIVTYDDTVNMREYIEVPLIDTLTANKKYCVEFYVSISNFCYNAISNVGAYFSIDTVFQNNSQFYALSSYIPQIENPITNMLNDTANWMLVSGNFIANGGERFMTIGNFHNPANTNFQVMAGGTDGGAYYYIDDVSVVDCTGDGVDEINKEEDITVYPNPATISITVTLLKGEGVLTIYNVLGEKVFTTKIINNQTEIDVGNLPKGMFFVEVQTNKGIIRKKVVKE